MQPVVSELLLEGSGLQPAFAPVSDAFERSTHLVPDDALERSNHLEPDSGMRPQHTSPKGGKRVTCASSCARARLWSACSG